MWNLWTWLARYLYATNICFESISSYKLWGCYIPLPRCTQQRVQLTRQHVQLTMIYIFDHLPKHIESCIYVYILYVRDLSCYKYLTTCLCLCMYVCIRMYATYDAMDIWTLVYAYACMYVFVCTRLTTLYIFGHWPMSIQSCMYVYILYVCDLPRYTYLTACLCLWSHVWCSARAQGSCKSVIHMCMYIYIYRALSIESCVMLRSRSRKL